MSNFSDKCTNQYSDIEEVLFNKENAGILQKAINSLPPQRRRIFKLCKIDGQSYDQVSEQLKISTSTISDHIVKANHCIRNYLWENYKL
ncbi:MAG: sigma-70 family RNA polymerase sigma factor [Segetibacter sp.]